jgi:hypothetical protein
MMLEASVRVVVVPSLIRGGLISKTEQGVQEMKTRAARSHTRGEKTKHKPPLKPLHRKIHIDRNVWTYKILGTGSRIRIRTPENNVTYLVPATDVLNTTWDNIERAHWKHYLSITPGDVKDYILRHLVPNAPGWAPEVETVLDFETKEEIDLYSTSCLVLLEPGHPWAGAYCPHEPGWVPGTRMESHLHLYHAKYWYKHEIPMKYLQKKVLENPSLETWAMFHEWNTGGHHYWKRVEVVFKGGNCGD